MKKYNNKNIISIKLLVGLLVVSLSISGLYAQQDPAYTQYMYNMSVINPAYATRTKGVYNLGALYRNQWVGTVGAPTTMTAFFHTPLNERVEAGLSIVSDEIGEGVLKENNITADMAYAISLGESLNVSFGLKAGVTTFDTRFNDLQLASGDFTTDPAFQENISSLFPVVGSGIFVFNEQFYFGASVPNFLSQKHIEEQNGINALGSEELHVFATAGYVFELSPMLKLKPSFLARYVNGAPLSADINTNVLINDKIEFGVSHRIKDSFSGLFNFAINPSLRVGYAYDFTTSNLGNFNSGTHEIMILFNLGKGKGNRFVSPRFF